MSAASSIGNMAFKVVTAVCVSGTVVGLGGLGFNIFMNTGSRRGPLPASPPLPSSAPSSSSSELSPANQEQE